MIRAIYHMMFLDECVLSFAAMAPKPRIHYALRRQMPVTLLKYTICSTAISKYSVTSNGSFYLMIHSKLLKSIG